MQLPISKPLVSLLAFVASSSSPQPARRAQQLLKSKWLPFEVCFLAFVALVSSSLVVEIFGSNDSPPLWVPLHHIVQESAPFSHLGPTRQNMGLRGGEGVAALPLSSRLSLKIEIICGAKCGRQNEHLLGFS